jgi:hypothetical protein
MESSLSSTSTALTAKTSDELNYWRSRVQAIQLERMTPDVRRRIQESSERQQLAKTASKKCKKLEKVNYLTSASNVSALSNWSLAQTAPIPRAAQVDLYQTHSMMQSAQTTKLQGIMKSAMSSTLPLPPSVPPRNVSAYQSAAAAEEDDWDEEDEALDELEREVMQTSAQPIQSTAIVLQSAVAGDVPNLTGSLNVDLLTLLEQVALEPTDAAELEAKFKLFENFLSTVTAIRETTLQFWEENRLVFIDGAMRSSAERQVKGIDSLDACAIDDDPTKWFVYSMLKKANENSAGISQLLASLRARLDILAQAPGECPICLDMIPADKCTILSCAHKVCTECWDHYSALMTRDHRGLVCPLCRHEEFVTQLTLAN